MSKVKTGTKEWSNHSVNSQIGCRHDCKYCYMKPMYKRFGQHPTGRYNEEFDTKPKIRKYGGVVMYPTRHDINLDNYKRCFDVIKRLLELGNKVLVVSKMHPIIAQEFAWHFKPSDNLEIRITITSVYDSLLKYWEPKAPCFGDRLIALKLLHTQGFNTSVSVEPALSYPERIVKEVYPFCTGDIWVGLLNHYTFDKMQQSENNTYNQTFGRIKEIYAALKDNPKVKFKDSFIKRLK